MEGILTNERQLIPYIGSYIWHRANAGICCSSFRSCQSPRIPLDFCKDLKASRVRSRCLWIRDGVMPTIRNICTLRWRHNGHDDVSNHRPRDCLLNRLFKRRSKNGQKPKLQLMKLLYGFQKRMVLVFRNQGHCIQLHGRFWAYCVDMLGKAQSCYICKDTQYFQARFRCNDSSFFPNYRYGFCRHGRFKHHLEFIWVGLHSEALDSHDYVMKWKHFPYFWQFVRGIHRSPVNSSHKGQWRGALMFSLICAWTNV